MISATYLFPHTIRAARRRLMALAVISAGLGLTACNGDTSPRSGPLQGGDGDGDILAREGFTRVWFDEQTIATRGTLSLPGSAAWLDAQSVRAQLVEYDPGSSARCAVERNEDYEQVLDAIGGVQWGYFVSQVDDYATPIFQSGYPSYSGDGDAGLTADTAGPAVEIAEADIVGVGESSALFLSRSHGLLLVDLTEDEPEFVCAAKLPGQVDQFYLHDERLVVMTESRKGGLSHLLHFDVSGDQIRFVESIDLGRSRVLDSRRFNNRLVLYTDLSLEEEQQAPNPEPWNDWTGDVAYVQPNENRVLRVFRWADRLEEELTETKIDESPDETFLTRSDLDRETETGTLVSSSSRFGGSMWASERYFVVTETVTEIRFEDWETRTYSICTDGHTVSTPYTHCTTEYETRPNPNYVEPDNNGGDRSCSGETLADCIRTVARESAKTISVPVGRTCTQAERHRYVCTASETKSTSYPLYDRDTVTKLHIYEYTEDGFIRLSDEVSEVDRAELRGEDLEASLETLPMSDEASQLRVPGTVQAIQFQNGYLYVISEGILQTYALAENSLLRTSTLALSDEHIQTTQFTSDKLYLSDASWSTSGEHSVLKVVDLSNAAFPSQSSQDRQLPGNHSTILPTTSGILTTGAVHRFDGESVNLLKVGLFEDPSADELSYLFLGTDLDYVYAGDLKALYFDGGEERLFFPYTGQLVEEGSPAQAIHRVGVSHIYRGELVSEGAADLFELPERVRPRPGSDDVLTFAGNSIARLLNQDEGTWAAQYVFSYFTPTAVYRYSDNEDYVEVLRLGNRCKLHFSPVDELNDREETLSDDFLCPAGNVRGYGRHLLWSASLGVSFDEQGGFEFLGEDRAAELWERSQERLYCLFSREALEGGLAIDPLDPPELSTLECMTREQYQDGIPD